MLQIMCPGLSTLAKICMTIPVGTASVERSFSQMKMIKTRLRNRLGEDNLSNLMKIAIESPESLADEDLEQIIMKLILLVLCQNFLKIQSPDTYFSKFSWGVCPQTPLERACSHAQCALHTVY